MFAAGLTVAVAWWVVRRRRVPVVPAALPAGPSPWLWVSSGVWRAGGLDGTRATALPVPADVREQAETAPIHGTPPAPGADVAALLAQTRGAMAVSSWPVCCDRLATAVLAEPPYSAFALVGHAEPGWEDDEASTRTFQCGACGRLYASR